MYEVHTLKVVHKDLKKLSRQAAARIVNFYLPELSKNPYLNVPLSGELNDKVKYVKFQNPDPETKYGTILFEHDKFGEYKQSVCKVYLASTAATTTKGFVAVSLPKVGATTSSAMIFVESTEPPKGFEEVILCKNEECQNQDEGAYVRFKKEPAASKDGEYFDPGGTFSNFTTLHYKSRSFDKIGSINDDVSAIEINGKYYAVLFGNVDYGGTCVVYKKSDPKVGNEKIGDNQASSLQLILIK